jgi:hypothetical protein
LQAVQDYWELIELQVVEAELQPLEAMEHQVHQALVVQDLIHQSQVHLLVTQAVEELRELSVAILQHLMVLQQAAQEQ